ncbi:hypothetical protein KPL71_008966 [Citrus sinensis]|uniref:Uncharacterized protein n=1 Tax=Citrus sinensis TaxID=2711 RepID=A0ACB8MAK5_CITSI|nr:hypothetical protein KPL71_008966 [Citrus sinensis]
MEQNLNQSSALLAEQLRDLLIENPEFITWKSQDQTLLGWLLSSISEGTLGLVINLDSSYTVWKTLEKKFGVQYEAKVLQIKYEINTLKKESMNVEDYCMKMKALADKLACAGSPLNDRELLLHILNGLGPGNLDLASFITACRMDFDDAYALLVTHKPRLEQQEQDAKTVFNANFAQGMFNGTGRSFPLRIFFGFNGFNGGYSGFGGYGSGQNMHQMKGKVFNGMSPTMPSNFSGNSHQNAASISYEVIICQICSKSGHSADVCWYRFNEDFIPAPSRVYNKGKTPKFAYMTNFEPVNYMPSYMPSFDEYSAGMSPVCMPGFHTPYSPGTAYMANFEGPADESWYFDSGATHHLPNNMTNIHIREEFKGNDQLIIGNGQGLTITHVGNASLRLSGSKTTCILLKDILLVPSITKNLLSISKLTSDNNISIEFCVNVCFVKDKMKGQVLLQGLSEKGLYKLQLKPSSPNTQSHESHMSVVHLNKPLSMLSFVNRNNQTSNKCDSFAKACFNFVSSNCTQAVDQLTLLHRKFGHPNLNVLIHLLKFYNCAKVSLQSLKNSSHNVCEACQLGKSHRLHFATTDTTTTHVLELIHTNLWGPSPFLSRNGYKYYISFVDDYSRYTWIYPLKLKEPDTVEEALEDPRWYQAMKDEYDALMKNNTWILVPKFSDHKVVDNKWIFRVKYNTDGSVAKFKARLVPKGFQQVAGVDYFETFSPDVFMMQPKGFINVYKPGHICKLNQALYGLKQAPRAWFDKLKETLIKWGFQNSRADTSLFLKKEKGSMIMFSFCLKRSRDLSYFLGIEVSYYNGSIFLSQRKYIRDLLAEPELLNCKGCDTPMTTRTKLQKQAYVSLGQFIEDPIAYRSLVGGLQYVILTRPEIAFAVHKLSQYVAMLTLQHLMACKRVLRYLKETQDYGLKFGTEGELRLTGYTDTDWACDIDDRNLVGAYCIYLENNLTHGLLRNNQL